MPPEVRVDGFRANRCLSILEVAFKHGFERSLKLYARGDRRLCLLVCVFLFVAVAADEMCESRVSNSRTWNK